MTNNNRCMHHTTLHVHVLSILHSTCTSIISHCITCTCTIPHYMYHTTVHVSIVHVQASYHIVLHVPVSIYYFLI